MKALIIPLILVVALLAYGGFQLWEVEANHPEDKKSEINEVTMEKIRLPLRVYLIKDLELEQKGVKMSTWLSAEEFRTVILPEINRIWKSAGIEWFLEGVIEQNALKTVHREEWVTDIQNARRDMVGKERSKRIRRIRAFCDDKKRHPVIHNLYFFPYLGQTFQGTADLNGNFAVMGVWTDKPSRGRKPPVKSLLVEKGPFRVGSIARTASHELGHNLGLKHPDKATQKEFNRLMGGRRHGYELTDDEVKLARENALIRYEKVSAAKGKR